MTITQYIREDLKARILSGREVPERFTLRELSSAYGVSMTPVRQAVDALIRERVVCKLDNGRLAVDPAALGRKPTARRETVEPPGTRDRAVMREVLKLSLQGRDTFMREETTARKHGVGRTVLRHALARLTAAGLLEHVPRRGWRVRPFRQEDMDAYLEVREILELKALALCRRRVAKADLRRIHDDNVTGGRKPKVDAELHGFIVAASGNRYLQDFFRRHGAYFTTLFYYATEGAAVTAEMARQHRAILGAMIAGRWAYAARELSRHIRAQRPALQRMLKRLASLPVEQWPEIPSLPP